MRSKFRLVLALTLLAPTPLAAQERNDVGVPTPESVLGFRIGADRTLADWDEITGYLSALARSSERVRLDTLGATTLGRPFVALTISSPENLAGLDEYLAIQRMLADPRRVETELEAQRLIGEGRAIVLMTGGIHSTEVGSYQVPVRIAYRLAAGDDETTRMILERVIVLLVPSLNPDGSQMVVDWYESTLDEPWEGAGPPFLYHHYVGHDNNRDWYAFTQRETRLTVTKLHNVWHPQIVHDIHQMGSQGPRFFVPPWTDPIEPNVDPLLVAGINAIGTAIAWAMHGQGKEGIAVNAIYDAWTPARAYQHYHAGVRILSETASARLGSPVFVPFDSLEARRGADPTRRSWNHPVVWPGGEWHLGDIVNYMESGAMALLEQAALYRDRWLNNFYTIGLRSIAGRPDWPRAFVIPDAGQNPDGLAEMLRILVTGDVEVRRASAGFRAAGRSFAEGTFVIDMAQPYAPFAKTLLERQDYPDLRQYEDGPLIAPYDVTAHTLPLMMGVEVHPVFEPLDVELSEPISAPRYRKDVPGLTNRERRPRVGLYESWEPSMDAGWTRWIFDEYGVGYERLHDADVRAGDLRDRYDAIILPDQPVGEIIDGHEPGTMPARYVGGLGSRGVSALREFVEAGGTLVALNRATRLPIQRFGLPVVNPMEGLDTSEFYVPGSILRVHLDPEHPLAAGMPARGAAWVEEGFAFEPADGARDRVEIAARYGTDELLLSGWITGAEHLAGHGALAVVRLGEGRIVLFGFRPQYRGQTVATYPLLFNALKWSIAD